MQGQACMGAYFYAMDIEIQVVPIECWHVVDFKISNREFQAWGPGQSLAAVLHHRPLRRRSPVVPGDWTETGVLLRKFHQYGTGSKNGDDRNGEKKFHIRIFWSGECNWNFIMIDPHAYYVVIP